MDKPNLDIVFYHEYFVKSFQTNSNCIYNYFMSYIGVKLFLWGLFFCLWYCHEKMNVIMNPINVEIYVVNLSIRYVVLYCWNGWMILEM